MRYRKVIWVSILFDTLFRYPVQESILHCDTDFRYRYQRYLTPLMSHINLHAGRLQRCDLSYSKSNNCSRPTERNVEWNEVNHLKTNSWRSQDIHVLSLIEVVNTEFKIQKKNTENDNCLKLNLRESMIKMCSFKFI